MSPTLKPGSLTRHRTRITADWMHRLVALFHNWTPSRRHLVWIPIGIFFIALGAFARIHAYLTRRSLWLDEAMLALNVATRTFAGLTHPLDDNQLAPWGFLFLSKTAVSALGVNEYALRLIPLLAGLIALPLLYRLARVCLQDPGAAVLATTLFALSPVALYQSSEFKQYSTDALWTLLILSVALPALRVGPTPRRILVLAAVGVLAVWNSYPSVFTLAAACALLIFRALRSSCLRHAIGSISVATVLSLNFLVSYRMATHPPTREVQRQFWHEAFLPFPPTSFWDVIRSLDVFNGLFSMFAAPESIDPVSSAASSLLALAIFIVGFFTFWHRDRWTLALLTAPIGLNIIASALLLYPVGGRLSLFVLPAVVIVMSAGLTDEWRAGRRTLCATLLSVLLFFPTLSALNALVRKPARDEIRPVLGYISARWQQGDVLFVNSWAVPAFTFYTRFGDARPWSLRDAILVRGDQRRVERYVQKFDVLLGTDRAWILFSHTYVHPEDERFYVNCLDRAGRRLEQYRAVGASAYLYTFSATSTEIPCFAAQGKARSVP